MNKREQKENTMRETTKKTTDGDLAPNDCFNKPVGSPKQMARQSLKARTAQ